MITRELTDLYLTEYNLLSEKLFFCWQNSYCKVKKQVDNNVLKKQIQKFGVYNNSQAIENYNSYQYKVKIKFDILTWVNLITDKIEIISCHEYSLDNQKTIKEIQANLFKLPNKHGKLAYANTILLDLYKNPIHGKNKNSRELNQIYKHFFISVLNLQIDNKEFINSPSQQNTIFSTNYNLTVGVLKHLDFIENLIKLFGCFEIDLISIAEKSNYNLYLFKEKMNNGIQLDLESKNIIHPKFNSPLSDDCLIKIMQFLFQKKKLNNPNVDTWLYWFNRKFINIPEPINWIGSNTMLSNIIQHLCGECCISIIKKAFNTTEFVKPTRKEYELSRVYKEIEQIITITKQKK